MGDVNQKEKKSMIKKVGIAILILIIVISTIVIVKYSNKIELTQLHDNTPIQMMGYIIKAKNNKIIVIDGGTTGDAQNLEQIIKKNGGKVDYWFITHPHIDHMGAFLEIVNNTDTSVGKIYTTYNDIEWYKQYANERENESENVRTFIETLQSEKLQGKVENVTLNEKFSIENINIEILGIANQEIITNPVNNSSMVIKMQINDKSVIFLGDSGKESGDKLLENQKEKLKADVVQMAHHGQNGVGEEVYKTIQPKICMWPTPEWLWNNDLGSGENSGNWKTFETRGWIEKLNVKQNIIEKDGDITIKIW